MGQESSSSLDKPPQSLESRSVDGLAKLIKDGKAKKIVVMSGAGISTSAGIPDFRSPDTGLYANLARLNLPYAEAVFDISYFRQNPLPFYTLAHELYPGKYRPTITHCFIRLLNDKCLLSKHFTQNIDCLDREAGVPGDKIVEAHGSFARQSCIECHTSFPDSRMKEHIKDKKVPRCMRPLCGGLVKPEIVFFGEALPTEFFMNRALPGQADLAIIMGTSLTVQPFASLPSMVSDGVPRVLINKEPVGSLGSRPDDILMIGDCDDGVRKLAAACGWLDELEKIWQESAPEAASTSKETKAKSKDELISDEVDKLTKEIDDTLKISKGLTDKGPGEQVSSTEKSVELSEASSKVPLEQSTASEEAPDVENTEGANATDNDKGANDKADPPVPSSTATDEDHKKEDKPSL